MVREGEGSLVPSVLNPKASSSKISQGLVLESKFVNVNNRVMETGDEEEVDTAFFLDCQVKL